MKCQMHQKKKQTYVDSPDKNPSLRMFVQFCFGKSARKDG